MTLFFKAKAATNPPIPAPTIEISKGLDFIKITVREQEKNDESLS